MGLPNTAELLTGVLDLAERSNRWGNTEQLPARLATAFEYFYPDAANDGYRPDVVDFFSALRTYIDVGAGMRGGFREAPELYRSLKFAIAQLLIERLREAEASLRTVGHPYLDKIVRPGNIAITSNWDLVLELYAAIRGVPVRLVGINNRNEFVLLKLHGSIDWCAIDRRSARYPRSDYAALRERLSPTAYPIRWPPTGSDLVRVRALENWRGGWSRISSRALDLHMVTMARGKTGDLGPLQQIWRDAYDALSRAAHLEIVGYSLPDEDIEIRTLLRGAIRRGRGPRTLVTRNPAPDVHERVWRLLDRHAAPNYQGIQLL